MKRTLGCIGSIAMLAASAFAVPAAAARPTTPVRAPTTPTVSLDFTVSQGKVKDFHARHLSAKRTDGTIFREANWKLAKSPEISHRAFSDREQRSPGNPDVVAHTTVHGKFNKSRERARGDFKLVFDFVSGEFAGDDCHTTTLDWTAKRQ